MHARIQLLALFFILTFAALVFKLFTWQIVKGTDLGREARSQYESGEALTAPRGSILASDGTWLAARGEAYQVYAEIPKITESASKIANLLAPYFVDDFEDKKAVLDEVGRLEELLSRKGAVWVPLRQKVSGDIKNSIEGFEIRGIGFSEVPDRIYPEASTAAQLLGFVGKDKDGNNVGYFGLEGYYDLTLSGKPGFAQGEKDAFGRPILVGKTKEIAAVDGVDLETHLDKAVEKVVSEELAKGIEKYGAVSGTATVMDPKTGAIIAMASFPSYDPKEYWKYSNDLFKNPVVSDSFEPGSVFKIVVMAAALDAGVVTPVTKCDICDGPMHVDKYVIETWNNKYYPDSTMTDVIVHSDNVGMSFVAQKLGADSLYDYLDKFGIGHLTGIDLQGEATPALRKKGTWNVVDLATASFGQGVAVTPIQMLTAGAAIANGGVLVTPQVVGGLRGDGWQETVEPKAGLRVISEKAAQEVTAMMVAAASEGESKWTAARGFSVAGKTGTAQIPISGHYDAEKTMASFIGFSPAKNPKFVMLVTLREPQSSQWASETAAPLWYAIAKDLFPYFGIQPQN
jgi:cell division protein FtsI/penicillin-binding protein 2